MVLHITRAPIIDPWKGRSVTKAYVGLGSNLGNPAASLDAACASLAARPQIRLLGCSSYWRSRAIGPQPQPDYCNAVCAIETDLGPEILLGVLLNIEDEAGRIREQRWGPRVLDLDLLHVDGVCWASATLILPHPQLHRRSFVLVPLAEIAPSLVIKNIGAVATLAMDCRKDGLQHWEG